MFNRNRNINHRFNHSEGFFSGIPLFFKLWFIFVLSLVLIVFGTVGYTFYSVASDPDATAREVGRIIGEVSKGYNETSNPVGQ